MAKVDGCAYILSEEVWLCIYQPAPDLHFPIAAAEGSLWRVLTWSIIKTSTSGDLTYIVILVPSHPGKRLTPAALTELSIETQFGSLVISLTSVGNIECLSSQLKQTVSTTLLRSLAYEAEGLGLEIISLLNSNFRHELSLIPPLDAMRAEHSHEISIKGIYGPRYVSSLDSDQPKVDLVKSIAFDCTYGDCTLITTERRIGSGRFLIITETDAKIAVLR